MSIKEVTVGSDVPNDINVIIEIPMNDEPIKYEVDKDSGMIMVDRILNTAMHYPCNYGYVPHTLCGDGDPIDVLVLMPYALLPGSVIKCRPIGVLNMTDESGEDAKVIAVPVDKISKLYQNVKDINDVNPETLNAIAHFFEHYKDLEKGKWVKISGWEGVDAAKREIVNSVKNHNKA